MKTDLKEIIKLAIPQSYTFENIVTEE